MKKRKYTISIDFDGVIHSYTSPWKNAHTIPDAPVPGAIEFLSEAIQDFQVVIHTARARTWWGRMAVRNYIRRHAGNLWYDSMGNFGIEDVKVTHKKLPALVYIDDRGYRFEGTFPELDDIHKMLPWNKKK